MARRPPDWLSLAAPRIACPMCGAAGQGMAIRRESFFGTGQDLSICTSCAGLYLDPPMTEDSLNRFYTSQYRKLYPFESAWSYGGRFIRNTLKREAGAYRSLRAAESLPPGATVLEVGSGFGDFLGALGIRRTDLTLYALEPDDVRRELLLGGVQVSFLDSWASIRTESVDAVYAFHVLEHLNQPLEVLAEIRRILKPGGTFTIEVPDAGADWGSWAFVHPAHISYFTDRTLHRMLDRAGFSVIFCGPHPVEPLMQGTLLAEVARGPQGTPPPQPGSTEVQRMVDHARAVPDLGLGHRIVKSALSRAGLTPLIGNFKRWRYFRQFSAHSPLPFKDVVAQLCRDFGEVGLSSRHEIYFMSRGRSRFSQSLRGMAAFIRDTFLLLRGPHQKLPDSEGIAVVTLPGASGWGTLAPAVRRADEAGKSIIIVAHPRVSSVSGQVLHRLRIPRWSACWKALLQGWRVTGKSRTGEISRHLVKWTVARQALWSSAWEASLHGSARWLLLHNDFDLMSASGLATVGSAQTACLQHGIPTAEFFPVKSSTHWLWGESSKKAYLAGGAPAESLKLAGLRKRNDSAPFGPPVGVAIVSQTHTPIFGIPMQDRLPRLAEALVELLPEGLPFCVCLHPEEARLGHPYTGRAQEHLSAPPHPRIRLVKGPWLIVGLASSWMLDMAQEGHYVLGLDWEVLDSREAWRMVQPPFLASNPVGIREHFTRLKDDFGFQELAAQAQTSWLNGTFHDDGGSAFLAWLESLP